MGSFAHESRQPVWLTDVREELAGETQTPKVPGDALRSRVCIIMLHREKCRRPPELGRVMPHRRSDHPDLYEH